MMKWVKLSVGCAVAALAASMAMAQDASQSTAQNAGQGTPYAGCPGMRGGPGMMWGYGPGMGPYAALNLNDRQRTEINQIQEQVRQRHWNLMGQMRDESIRLRTMMAVDKPDPAAVGQQQMKVADIHRQMLESSVDARNRIESLLTGEQKAQLRSMYSQTWSPVPGTVGISPETGMTGK